MPPTKRISKEAIVDAAVEVLRSGGASAVNARSVAKKLGCSTQPIYLSFQSMNELKTAVTQQAVEAGEPAGAGSGQTGKVATPRQPGAQHQSAQIKRNEDRAPGHP